MLNKRAFLFGTAAVTVAFSTPAWAGEFAWDRWGGNKFAETAEDAIARVGEALAPMSMPQEAKALLADNVRAHPEGRGEVQLVPGFRFREMQSGGGLIGSPQYDAVVVGSDSRYRGTRLYAKTWTVVCNGTQYTLFMPEICFNWAWSSQAAPREAPPPPREPECVYLEVCDVRPGDTVHTAVITSSTLPSECWARSEDGFSNNWIPWSNECPTDFVCPTPDWLGAFPTYAGHPERSLTFRMRGPGTLVLRLPPEVRQQHVVVCVLRDGRRSYPYGVDPTDWQGRRYRLERSWVWER